MKNKSDDEYTESETKKRFTAALARALSTPHKLQVAKKKKFAKKKKGGA